MPSTPERRCLIAGSWGGRGHTTTDNARTQGRFGPTQFFLLLLRTLPLPDRLLVVIDDSPTKRYGPKVEGVDIHRNPTPGPADQKYLYWTPAVDLDHSPEPVAAFFPIRFIADNRLWLVPAGHHVIEGPGECDP